MEKWLKVLVKLPTLANLLEQMGPQGIKDLPKILTMLNLFATTVVVPAKKAAADGKISQAEIDGFFSGAAAPFGAMFKEMFPEMWQQDKDSG